MALISLDSKRLLPPSITVFRRQSFTFTSDGSSSPWIEGSGRLYICLVMAVNSTFSCDFCSYDHNSKLKAPVRGTLVLYHCPLNCDLSSTQHTGALVSFYPAYRLIQSSTDLLWGHHPSLLMLAVISPPSVVCPLQQRHVILPKCLWCCHCKHLHSSPAS